MSRAITGDTETGEHVARRSSAINSQTTLSLALVIALVGGGIQYGRQAQRIDSMEREIGLLSARVADLTSEITSLRSLLLRAAATVPRETDGRHD